MSFFTRLIPFIFLGITIVLLVAGLILLSYLLIYGAIVGLILFSIAWIRDIIFKNKSPPIVKKPRGRTLDHDQ